MHSAKLKQFVKYNIRENVSTIDIKDENDDEIKSQIHKLISEKISAAVPSKFSECATSYGTKDRNKG